MSDEPEWMPDPLIAKRYGVSLMALYRWDRANIGFPPPTKINGKNYRNVPQLREFDEQLKRKALKEIA